MDHDDTSSNLKQLNELSNVYQKQSYRGYGATRILRTMLGISKLSRQNLAISRNSRQKLPHDYGEDGTR